MADCEEVQMGDAVIYSNVEGSKIQEFKIEITEINQSDSSGKDIVFKVRDDELIQKTGGVVRGMSGSPIIQNDKIIGSVTHVLVNEPTMEMCIRDRAQVQKIGVGYCVSHGFPVHHIFGMGDGNTGEVLERGVDHIVVLSNSDYRWVGIKSSANRVLVCHNYAFLKMNYCFFALPVYHNPWDISIGIFNNLPCLLRKEKSSITNP